MSLSAAFLYRFLDDVWDLLPTEDRELFETYWLGLIRASADLQQKTMEANASLFVEHVPVFLTERWNRFVADDATADLFSTTETLELDDLDEVQFLFETVHDHTLVVSNESRNIPYTENIKFFDSAPKQLRYAKIIDGTDNVRIAELKFTLGRDYTINRGTGEIQATANSRIPEELLIQVSYGHEEYTRDLDYVIDKDDISIARLTGTTIPDGEDSPQILTLTGNAAGTETVTVGERVYTFQAVLTDVDGNVLVGATASDSIDNLIAAINGGTGAGTLYAASGTAHPRAQASIGDGDTMNAISRRTVTSGYTLALATTLALGAWSGSTLPDGASIQVTYTYNATATIPFVGSDGGVLADLKTFVDLNARFDGLSQGRTLNVLSGLNTGTYTIGRILSPTSLEITGAFDAVQTDDIRYTVNAFPHAIRVDKAIASIPVLQNLIENPDTVLVEGIDYIVSGGTLASRKAFPIQTIGPEDIRELALWAEVTKIDAQTPYRNFGVLIDFFRENSEEYKLALQGLWFTFWTGSTQGNLRTGLHILLGLPFARNPGTVVLVTDTQVQIEDSRGQILTYTIPAGLVSTVARGDVVEKFARLVNGVQIIDRINTPGFVSTHLGRSGIDRFLTDDASRGLGDTDETKALTLLENHLFLPQILADAVSALVNVTEFVTFLDNLKPQWTEYRFSFAVEESETITVADEGDLELDFALNLTTTATINEFNKVEIRDLHTLDGAFGKVLATGSQATGNFEDTTRDFAAAGIGKGAVIHILEGVFIGLHSVLERQSSSLLSLDIPDVELVAQANLDWDAITVEQARLNHDAPTVRDPNIVMGGANYSTPSTFAVKTDADFASTMLTDLDVQAMLLIDILIAGDEVQAITDSDIAGGEIDVGTAPGGVPVAQAHEIASVALVRVDNLGPTVTDAVAI